MTRSVVFSSSHVHERLSLTQRLLLRTAQGVQLVEEWRFDFGFVIPGSTNAWESMVEADEDGVLPADVLSGNLLVESEFFDGDVSLGGVHVVIDYV